MSLFKTREFWSADLTLLDLIDNKTILIGDVGGITCIFVGSHDGYLRVFCPNNSAPAVQKPSDLVYETLFQYPLLQLGIGAVVSGSAEKQLIVLHPRALSVYQLQRVEGSEEAILALRLAYTHQLPRSAFSFVTGTFGKVRGREFICVQSLDGVASFFEQEAPTFQVQIPNIILPTEFCYVPTIDAFLFQDANHYLTIYSYENLSDAGHKKKLASLWAHNIGEFLLGINCHQFGDSLFNILLLCERNYYNIGDDGKIIWMKRLEFRPICFTSYMHSESYNIMSLIATEFQTLNLYENTCLKWCTGLDFIPITVSLTHLTNLKGLILLISETGYLQLVYLGTIPSIYVIPPAVEPEINVAEAETELKTLQSAINENEISTNVSEDVLSIKLRIEDKIEVEGNRTSCPVVLDIETQIPINKVQVIFIVEPPLVATPNSLSVSSVLSKEVITANVYVGGNTCISNLSVKAVVSYVLSNGKPRVLHKVGELPLDVAASICTAGKDAAVKLTLVTNKPTCPLNEIFPGPDASTNAVALNLLGSNSKVTIVAAKTSQRYRLQSDRLEDMSLVLEALISKLNQRFRKTPDFNLTYSSSLPLQFYFKEIDMHFELVTRKRLKKEQLAQRTTQYRIIQKKVLITLKDLTPKPTGALYRVLDDTYAMIKSTILQLEQIEMELEVSRSRLAALGRLIITLLKLMTIKKTDMEYLHHVFNPIIYNGDDQGWLEVQNATISLLMRTAFAKSSKDQNKPTDLTLEPVSDVSKLCKLFTSAIDRVTKGTSLLERTEFEEEKESIPTVASVKNWESKKDILVPTGSKMADLNAPLPVRKPSPVKRVPSPQKENSQAIPVEAKVIIEANLLDDDAADLPVVEVKAKNAVPSVSTVNKPIVTHTQKKTDHEEDAIWDLTLEELNI